MITPISYFTSVPKAGMNCLKLYSPFPFFYIRFLGTARPKPWPIFWLAFQKTGQKNFFTLPTETPYFGVMLRALVGISYVL